MQCNSTRENRDFCWRAASGPYQLLTTEQARQYEELGYVRVEGAFSDAEVREVTAAIDPLEARFTQMLKDKFDGTCFIARADAITFTINLVKRSPVRMYWDQAVYKKPGNPEEFSITPTCGVTSAITNVGPSAINRRLPIAASPITCRGVFRTPDPERRCATRSIGPR